MGLSTARTAIRLPHELLHKVDESRARTQLIPKHML